MKFTKDFTPAQFKEIEKRIKLFFAVNNFQYNTNHEGTNKKPFKGNFEQLDKIIGFAYTSSGVFAGYWSCNGINVFSELLPKGFNHFNGFTYSLDGDLYALFEDENEKQFLIKA
jgi:hypothetical protein